MELFKDEVIFILLLTTVLRGLRNFEPSCRIFISVVSHAICSLVNCVKTYMVCCQCQKNILQLVICVGLRLGVVVSIVGRIKMLINIGPG